MEDKILKAGQKLLCIKSLVRYNSSRDHWAEEFIAGHEYEIKLDSRLSHCVQFKQEVVHRIINEELKEVSVWHPDFEQHFILLTMKISLIAAIDTNNGIGKENKLLCHLPNDMKHFKNTTTGHVVIMGRKTYESLGKYAPLPNRTNFVISRNKDLKIDGAKVYESFLKGVVEAIQLKETELFVIGGGEIYTEAIKFAHKIYLTKIHESFESDTLFPRINLSKWKEIKREDFKADEKHAHDYSIMEYERI